MTIKRRRFFWSYDVEATEAWLEEMAADGYNLIKVNNHTRTFTFKKGNRKKASFQIVFDKTNSPLSDSLKDNGWETTLTTGHWAFLKNEAENIQLFPIRDGIFKRNQLHSMLLSTVSILYGVQFLLISTFFFILLISGDEGSIEPSPLWAIPIIYYIQVVVVIGLAVYAHRKIRSFERKFFHTGVDRTLPTGKTWSKWKFRWTDAPDLFEAWLEEQAATGSRLVEISNQNGRMIFHKDAPQLVSHVIDFQWKTSPSYYDVHKSAGWELKYTSAFPIMKYSLWEKEYSEGEEKPQLTYDTDEEDLRVKRLFLGNITSHAFMVAIILYALFIAFFPYEASDRSILEYVLIGIITIASFEVITRITRTIRSLIRIRRDSLN